MVKIATRKPLVIVQEEEVVVCQECEKPILFCACGGYDEFFGKPQKMWVARESKGNGTRPMVGIFPTRDEVPTQHPRCEIIILDGSTPVVFERVGLADL